MKGIRLRIPIPAWLFWLVCILMAFAGGALMYMSTTMLWDSQAKLGTAKRVEGFKVLP